MNFALFQTGRRNRARFFLYGNFLRRFQYAQLVQAGHQPDLQIFLQLHLKQPVLGRLPGKLKALGRRDQARLSLAFPGLFPKKGAIELFFI